MDRIKLAKARGQQDLDRIDQIIREIKQNMERPGSTPLTSDQMRQREQRRQSVATGLKLQGRPVNKDYE